MSPNEHGDRAAFLAPICQGLAGRPVVTGPQPVPEALPLSLPPTGAGSGTSAATADLLDHFVVAAEAAGAEVLLTEESLVPLEALQRWCETHEVARAVCAAGPEAQSVGTELARLGVEVDTPTPAEAARAELGVTSATALIASTGTLVVRSDTDGRLASLLPPVHLCVVPADRVVATAGSVLRTLGRDGLPAGLVFITGTSRTGDIEQLLTRRVHGPGTVLVVVTDSPSALPSMPDSSPPEKP